MADARPESHLNGIHPRVALVQDGARGHYGLAIALNQAGILEVMYTDFFMQPGSVWDRFSPFLKRAKSPAIRRMLDRKVSGLEGVRIESSLLRRLRQDRRRPTFKNDIEFCRWQSADWGQWIAPRLGDPVNILMGFIRNIDPHLCAIARGRGIMTVADQMIAPAAIESREVALQQQRFPAWETLSADILGGFAAIERDTWAHLDAITCPSQYVADGLLECGVPAERIHVVHYPIDEKLFQFVDRAGRSGPVRVGFVGQINLRKGVPYFIEVAKKFSREQVTFTLVGQPFLTDTALAEVRKHVDMVTVPRSAVAAQLASFDLIYFPTTCEGSAYALMEAMASGLPLVTSPNSGTVARHGMEGFLCPYDDVETAASSIEQLVQNPTLRHDMGRAARRRYEQFGLSRYTDELSSLCHRLLGAAKSAATRNP
jgi:glycosyltransferase involved in cell wall biosynthesis